MADSDDVIPPIPTPPEDLGISPVVPPVEAPPVAPAPPYGAPAPVPAESAPPAAPVAPPAPAYGAPAAATPPPAPPAYAAQPAYPAQPGYPAAQPGYVQPGYAQPGYAQPGYAQPYAAQPAGPPKGLSVTSMVLGIVGVLFAGVGLLLSIGAIITGHLAQRSQPYAKGFWLTGIITGYVGAGIALLVIFFYVAVFIAAAGYNS